VESESEPELEQATIRSMHVKLGLPSIASAADVIVQLHSALPNTVQELLQVGMLTHPFATVAMFM
jgi:hypothetical protein